MKSIDGTHHAELLCTNPKAETVIDAADTDVNKLSIKYAEKYRKRSLLYTLSLKYHRRVAHLVCGNIPSCLRISPAAQSELAAFVIETNLDRG